MTTTEAREIARTPWSVSLHKSMRTCQRRFAFQHLVASGLSKDPFRRRAYIAKQAQDLTAWQGHVIHDVLANEFLTGIRAGKRVDLAELTAAADEVIHAQLEFSRALRFAEDGMTKAAAGRSYCVLRDHLRGADLTNEQVDDVRTTVRDCFQFLLGHEDFINLLIRGRQHQAEVSLRFAVAGWPVRATLDLGFLEARDRLWIVDWKIARSLTADYSHQLRLYALAALSSDRWGVKKLGDVRLLEANLLQRRIRRHPVTQDAVALAEDYAFRGIVELRALLSAADDPVALLDELDTANVPTTCRFCSYSDLCVESLASAGRARAAEVVQGTLW